MGHALLQVYNQLPQCFAAHGYPTVADKKPHSCCCLLLLLLLLLLSGA
jgi:hypothetical protein